MRHSHANDRYYFGNGSIRGHSNGFLELSSAETTLADQDFLLAREDFSRLDVIERAQ